MTRTTTSRRLQVAAIAILSMTALAACGHMMTMLHGGADRPAAEEFGLGPRPTAAGLYTLTLEPQGELVKRRLQTLQVRVLDAERQPVEGASITVDGGMPQHRHGLPTRPRVTRYHGGGVYDIEGVRFNMGGWWELKLGVSADAGRDSVTFNIDL
jgi:hypothetical protein